MPRSAQGQRSGITWDYALMLAQVPRVKADRMVISYVARAIDCPPNRLVPAKAAALVHGVAKAKGGTPFSSTTRSGVLSPGAHSRKNQSRNRQRPNGLPLFVTAPTVRAVGADCHHPHERGTRRGSSGSGE